MSDAPDGLRYVMLNGLVFLRRDDVVRLLRMIIANDAPDPRWERLAETLSKIGTDAIPAATIEPIIIQG